MNMPLCRLALLLSVTLIPATPSFAQADREPTLKETTLQDTATPDEAAAEEQDTLEPPADVAAAIEMSGSLPEAAEGLGDIESSALLSTFLDLIGRQQAALAEALDAGANTPERLGAPAIRADLGTLLSTTESLVEALAKRGIDVAATRSTLEAARKATEPTEDEGSGAMTRNAALELDLEVLRSRLRPMTRADVELTLAGWLELLRQVCVEVRDLEIAMLTSSDSDQEVSLNERAVLLRGERGRLIGRVNAVIDAIEMKGGDAADARAYVSSVVATPPITGFGAAVTTAMTWLRSPDGGIAVALNIFTAFAILFISYIVSRILGGVASRAMKRARGTSSLLKGFVVVAIQRGTLAIGFLIALTTLGANMGPLLAAIGAAGLVVGLALQGTLGNLASGLMIMVFRPFDVDDVVDVAGANGKVMGMNLMTTEVRTFDNRTVYVPNGRIWGDVITNVTANNTRRVDMVFGIGYGDDGAKARGIIEAILERNDKILDDPASLVRLHELADSSVNFIVRPWSKTSDYWDVYWEVTEAVKTEFDAQGISIPFPQRDIHVIQESQDNHVIIPRESEPTSATTSSQQEVAADS